VEFVREQARAQHADLDGAAADPLVAHAIGELAPKVRAAEALFEWTRRAVDIAERAGGERADAELFNEANVAVSEAKLFGAAVALEVGERLFTVGGARSSMGEYALDRFWRNARTHSLQQPLLWSQQALGAWYLDGTPPTGGSS
jgi:alkylation response protein AidB-like acyl-CoA dehydrogenase